MNPFILKKKDKINILSLTHHFFFPRLQVKESPSEPRWTINYKKSSPGLHFKPKLKDQVDKVIPQVKHLNTNEDKHGILLLRHLMTVTSICALLNSGSRLDCLVYYCSASRMTLLWQEMWDSFLK